MTDLPPFVIAARARAEVHDFELSSEPGVGSLLAALAAGVPEGGRILELGTGAGVGLAWLVGGLGDRTDVEVVTVDIDETLQSAVRSAGWPTWVRFELGDGAELLPSLGHFDLIFADAPGGKTYHLDRSVAALRPGGHLVVDDMAIYPGGNPLVHERIRGVRAELLAFHELVCAELDYSSGVILATKRRA